MFCPSCGAQLPDGLNFCTSCGARLEAGSADAQSAPAQPQSTPQEPQSPPTVPLSEPTVVLSPSAQPQYAQPQATVPPSAPREPQSPPTVPLSEPTVVLSPSAQPQYTQSQYAQPQYAQYPPQYAPAAQQYAPRTAADPRRAGSVLLLLGAISMVISLFFDFISIAMSAVQAIDGGWFSYNVVYYVATFISTCIMLALFVGVMLTFIKTKKKTEPLPVGGALSTVRAVTIVLLVWTLITPVAQMIFNALGDFGEITYAPSFFYRPLIRATLYLFAILAVSAAKKAKTNATVIIAALLCFASAAVDLYSEIAYYVEEAEYLYGVDYLYELPFTFNMLFAVISSVLFGILLLVYSKKAKAAARG